MLFIGITNLGIHDNPPYACTEHSIALKVNKFDNKDVIISGSFSSYK